MATNIFTNPSFELGTVGSTPTGWTDQWAGMKKSSDSPFDGSYCAKSKSPALSGITQSVDLTNIDYIRVYAKTTGKTGRCLLYAGSHNVYFDHNLNWTLLSLDVRSLSGVQTVSLRTNNKVGYFDLIYNYNIQNTISGNVKDSDGNNLNNVTITLEDGTNYSTSTNISGNYSQVVDPDVYTVIASLARYLDSSASVDASAGDQTQNFVLLKPVIYGNVQNSNGINLPSVAISLEDDTDYSTNTDANGDYSQTVDPDVYDVVASIPGNTDQSASVDATLADQTQDFVFPITTAPHDKAIRLKERYLVE